MFHQVRVFDSRMNLKETISSQELDRIYWNRFYEQDKKLSFKNSYKKHVPAREREGLAFFFQGLAKFF
jgi:hypothetical protein